MTIEKLTSISEFCHEKSQIREQKSQEAYIFICYQPVVSHHKQQVNVN